MLFKPTTLALTENVRQKFMTGLGCANRQHDPVLNKKDGYRQQNVRQRQKFISIIDYDVCMTFY